MPHTLCYCFQHCRIGWHMICLFGPLCLICSSVLCTSSELGERSRGLLWRLMVDASQTWHFASLGMPVPSSWWSDNLAVMLTARCFCAEPTHPLAGSQARMEWHIGMCEHSVSRQLVTQRWRWPDSVAPLCVQVELFCPFYILQRVTFHKEGFFLHPPFPASWEYLSSLSFLLWSSISPLRNGKSQWDKTWCADCICLCKCTQAYENAYAQAAL